MEDWIIAPTAAVHWMSGIALDTRMVAGIQPCPAGVPIWIGFVCLWIFTSMCFLVDARNMLRYTLEEEVPSGSVIGDVLSDSSLKREFGHNIIEQLQFSFLSEPNWNISVDHSTGVLRTKGRVDREGFPSCVSKVVCEITVDVAVRPIQYFRSIKVTIEITDTNDNAPEFGEKEITHPILESTEHGNSFTIPPATDPDSPVFGVVRYELESHRKTFSINVVEKLDGSLDVQLTIDRRLDRERRHHYKVKVVAYDGGEPAKLGRLDISIPILDSNDNSPIFDEPVYNINIPENLAAGTSILQVQATDKDLGPNSRIQYNFSIQTQSLYGNMLSINPNTGEIFTKGVVDREQLSICNLVVTARDSGPNSFPSDTTVVITVVDANDNAPEVTVSTLGSSKPDVAVIPENSDVGTFVAHIIASDPDEGPNGMINCTLNDYTFSLKQLDEAGEYQLLTGREVDRENIPQYGLELVCRDNGQPPQVTTKRITVDVLDVNDNAPQFSQNSYRATIMENNYINKGILQTHAQDRDKGKNGQIRYSLSENVSGVFEIDPEGGGIKAIDRIDREKTQKFDFHVIATDLGEPPKSSFALVIINIDDVDDSIPQFVFPTFTFRVTENEPVGSEVGKVTAADEDVPPNNQFFYSFQDDELSRSFHLNSKTGQIMSQRSLDREIRPEYKLVVKATDRKHTAMSSTAVVTIFVLDVNDNAPKFIFPSPHNDTVSISNKVPVGYRITKSVAHDPDDGDNARLTFTIISGNDRQLFQLDDKTGELRSTKPFSDIPLNTYILHIQIQDNGKPSHEARQQLRIVVDSSIVYPPPEAQARSPIAGKAFHYNVIVVVAVACGATVIVVSCIICIVLVRKNKQRRNNCSSGKANGPTESHRMLTAKDSLGSNDDQIAMKDIDGIDISESMKKLLVANSRDWERSPTDLDNQGEIGLEITKVLSEMEDETADLPELLSHTRGRGVPGENGGVPSGVCPPSAGPPKDDHEEGDSDTTAELNMTPGQTLAAGHDETTARPNKPPLKGKVSFSSDDQSSPRAKPYQYPPPPPPPPNRLRTFCPDGRLPESPQRSCLVSEKENTLPRRCPKVVTWQPSPEVATENRNYENGNFDHGSFLSGGQYGLDIDPWEERKPGNKVESMIV